MTADAARVSVIIPAYNAAHFIGEAIASIRAQCRAPDEIIVVDDGSSDQTVAAAARCGSDIRILSAPENRGPAAARNRGIEAATGDVLAFLDADDLWPADATALLLERLGRTPYAAIVAGRINLTGAFLPTRPAANTASDLEGFAMHFGCVMIRRQVFHQIGLLDARLRCGEDSDWFLRARERGVPIAVLDATTLIYRRHGANMTRDETQTMSVGLASLKRSLDRRRAAGRNAVSLPRWPIPRD